MVRNVFLELLIFQIALKLGTLVFLKYDTCEKMLNLFWDFNGLQ